MGLGFFGKRKPQAGALPIPEALPDDSFEQAFKPYEPEQKKPGAFAKDGLAWKILGTLGDGFQTWGGGQPTYVPQMLDLQQQTERERQQLAMYERRRGDDWTDFQRQRDYEVAHPKPVNNDTTNDYAFIAEKLGPEVANQYLRNLGDPTATVPLPNGQVYSGPRSGLGAALGGQSAPRAPKVTDGASYNALPPGAQYIDPNGNLRTKGGAAPTANRPFSTAPANGFVPPSRINSGQMTSGRRTPQGNKLVGGVDNSVHLTPNAADYWGSNLPAVLQEVRQFPGLRRAFIHNAGSGKHVHAEGEGWNTPYFGRRGAAGAR